MNRSLNNSRVAGTLLSTTHNARLFLQQPNCRRPVAIFAPSDMGSPSGAAACAMEGVMCDYHMIRPAGGAR